VLIVRQHCIGVIVAGSLLAAVGCGRGTLRHSTPHTSSSTPPSAVLLASLNLPMESLQPAIDATHAPLSGPNELDVYVEYALANNQVILAAINEVSAARDRVPQVSSLEDPTLMAQGYPFFPNTPQTASGRVTGGVAVSQKVPWFGKLRLQGAIACDELRIAEAQLAATRLEITEQVKRT